MDLASFLNISLKPLAGGTSHDSSGYSQYDRQQPSVIKEEEENEGLEDEDVAPAGLSDVRSNTTPDIQIRNKS